MDPIVHFELPIKGEESKIFYKNIFGWELAEMPEMDYTMVKTTEVGEDFMPKNPGTINGGMLSIKDNGSLNPVLVIMVPNIDNYITKIEKAGGQIVMPKVQVGDMGWTARFTDPSGVVMGLWEVIQK